MVPLVSYARRHPNTGWRDEGMRRFEDKDEGIGRFGDRGLKECITLPKAHCAENQQYSVRYGGGFQPLLFSLLVSRPFNVPVSLFLISRIASIL